MRSTPAAAGCGGWGPPPGGARRDARRAARGDDMSRPRTRMVLLAARAQLGLAEQGADLLEQKRDALLRELYREVRIVFAAPDELEAAAGGGGAPPRPGGGGGGGPRGPRRTESGHMALVR